MNKKKQVYLPEGEGFEIDYDKYNANGEEKFATADDWWESYCLSGQEELEQCSFRDDLIAAMNGDELMAMVVNHFIGDNYLLWLDNVNIEELGGISPRECLKFEFGIKRLKMLFLMMH